MTGKAEQAGLEPEQLGSQPTTAECESAMTQLHAFLDQELAEADADQIRAHLDLCEKCFDEFDLDQAVKQMIKRCCGSRAPADLKGKVLSRLKTSATTAQISQRD